MSDLTLDYPVAWPSEQYRRGFRNSPRHSGIDYGWRSRAYVGLANETKSKQILAAAPGIVLFSTNDGDNNQDWGNRTGIQHTDRAWTAYAHAETGTSKVRKGQVVAAGHVLAVMGATGKVIPKGAVHLHFELYIDGVRVDPAPYLKGKKLPGNPVVKPAPATGGGVKPVPSTGMSAGQRKTRNQVAGRTAPTTTAAKKQTLKAGTVGNFDGFARGQKVTQDGVTSNIWFRGAYGHNWFWAGHFTSQSTSGLKDMTPKAAPAKPAPKPKPKPAPAPKKFTTPAAGQFHYGGDDKAKVNYGNALRGVKYKRPALPGGRTYNVVKNPGTGPVLITVPGLGNVWVGTRRNPARVK